MHRVLQTRNDGRGIAERHCKRKRRNGVHRISEEFLIQRFVPASELEICAIRTGYGRADDILFAKEQFLSVYDFPTKPVVYGRNRVLHLARPVLIVKVVGDQVPATRVNHNTVFA